MQGEGTNVDTDPSHAEKGPRGASAPEEHACQPRRCRDTACGLRGCGRQGHSSGTEGTAGRLSAARGLGERVREEAPFSLWGRGQQRWGGPASAPSTHHQAELLQLRLQLLLVFLQATPLPLQLLNLQPARRARL